MIEPAKITNPSSTSREVPALKAELLAHEAQATLKLGRAGDARLLLEQAKELITENYPNEVWAIADAGKLVKHSGDCYKLDIKHSEALKAHEQALNLFFIATAKRDDKLTDFAGLATAIGLLYEQNNLEEETYLSFARDGST